MKVQTGFVDPVWVVGSSDGLYGYVGLFHSGEVVRISLDNGSVATVAEGLSCPEGVALDDHGNLMVVENPVGDECEATFPLKKAAQLTRVNIQTGLQTKVRCALCVVHCTFCGVRRAVRGVRCAVCGARVRVLVLSTYACMVVQERVL